MVEAGRIDSSGDSRALCIVSLTLLAGIPAFGHACMGAGQAHELRSVDTVFILEESHQPVLSHGP